MYYGVCPNKGVDSYLPYRVQQRLLDLAVLFLGVDEDAVVADRTMHAETMSKSAERSENGTQKRTRKGMG